MSRKRQKHIALIRRLIYQERADIERFEQQGSYADETPSTIMPGFSRGQAIRQADYDKLRSLEARLAQLEGRNGD